MIALFLKNLGLLLVLLLVPCIATDECSSGDGPAVVTLCSGLPVWVGVRHWLTAVGSTVSNLVCILIEHCLRLKASLLRCLRLLSRSCTEVVRHPLYRLFEVV